MRSASVAVWSTRSRARARRGSAGGAEQEVFAELRRFYRLTNARKRAHIERTS